MGWKSTSQGVSLALRGWYSYSMSPNLTKYTFWIPVALLSRLRAHSAKTGVPVAETIRRAIEALLQEYKY